MREGGSGCETACESMRVIDTGRGGVGVSSTAFARERRDGEQKREGWRAFSSPLFFLETTFHFGMNRIWKRALGVLKRS